MGEREAGGPAATTAMRVLVVDDAPEFHAIVVPLLEAEGFEVITAGDATTAVEAAHQHRPDLIVLDLTLPDRDGLDVCRELRRFSDAYVIIVTARTSEPDRVVGLEVGADDYLTKPFSPRELVARVRAMLRRPRATTTAPGERAFGALRIDVLGREVHVSGVPVQLTRTEFDLLATLSSRPEMVFSRDALREQVWGPNWFGDDHVVDVHIANLRRKIDIPGTSSFIRTVRGVGYRIEGQDPDNH